MTVVKSPFRLQGRATGLYDEQLQRERQERMLRRRNQAEREQPPLLVAAEPNG